MPTGRCTFMEQQGTALRIELPLLLDLPPTHITKTRIGGRGSLCARCSRKPSREARGSTVGHPGPGRRSAPTKASSGVQQAGSVRSTAERSAEFGHVEIEGTSQVDLHPPVCRDGYCQPLSGRLDDRSPRVRRDTSRIQLSDSNNGIDNNY